MEDNSIIRLYIDRSQFALVETKNKYGAYCRAIARNILFNSLDIEECENDTYLAAWQAIPPTIPTKLSAFLGRIIRNIALDKYSYNNAKKRNDEFNIILDELEQCLSDQCTVESEYEAGELINVINKYLYGIDKVERIIFVRRYWYSDSIGNIATMLNMSSSKVKSRLFRTRNKLKVYLEKEGINI